MTDLNRLASLMRNDWNRRISHDARFWMSDGYVSEDAMWSTGARDLALLLDGISLPSSSACLLEVGCGIGRLLRAALGRFDRVIGIDVSDRAIEEARALYAQIPESQGHLEFKVGNGIDLREIESGSVDVVVSFAALTSMPADVVANYLREFHRVTRAGGRVRLQMYLGREHRVCEDDTLHIRCYAEDRFVEAARLAGFDLDWIRPLTLPLQVSIEEQGVRAVIVSLHRTERQPLSQGEVSRALLPTGEMRPTEISETEGFYEPGLEHWVSLNYAKELAERGDTTRARETLAYAAQCARTAAIDVSDILQSIQSLIERKEKGSNREVVTSLAPAVGSWREANQRALAVRSERTQLFLTPGSGSAEVRMTGDGPVVWLQGQCLDHAEKPVAAARSWAQRILSEGRIKECRHIVVYGFGAGYHVEALLSMSDKRISVIEPSPAVFDAAIAGRDLTRTFQKLYGLSVGFPEGDPRFDFLDQESELVIRPQSQTVSGDFCTRVKALSFGARGLTALHPSIAVLGPFMGGTLPIAGYCARALFGLDQRLRSWDVSGFASSLGQFEKFVFEPMRRDTLRGAYIEMVSQVLLEAATEKPVDILICMAQAPVSGRVLTELRKRGVVTVLWFMEDYLRFTYWREMAQYYDFVFTIQRGECVDRIRAAGAGAVHYLPMACDPGIHRPVTMSEEERRRWGSPVSFVGAGYHNRQQTFAGLADLPFKIWGTEWPTCRPFDRLVQEEGRRLTPEEYIKIFNATEVNLNLHSSSERDGVDPSGDFVNPRTFELAACGAFQLCDHRSHLSELFEAGSEIVTFASPREMKDQIAYYLAHPEERARITQRGRERALREHTYQHRIAEMLRIIYSVKFDHLKRRAESSPWKRMIDRAKPHPELHQRCLTAFRRGEEPNLDGLVSDIVTGKGKLSETEQKLLFLHHIRSQMVRMRSEELGMKK